MKATRVLAASVLAGSLLLVSTACSNNDPAVESSPSVTASSSETSSATPSAAPSETPAPGKDAALIGPDVNSSAPTATPGITADPNASKAPEAPIVTSADSVAVMETINSYYAFVVSPEAKPALDKLSKNFTGGEPTPEQLQAAVASSPEVFAYYDTSSSENIKKAIEEFAMSAGMTSMGGDNISFNAPAEAVTVDGNTAKLDAGAVIVTVNGEKMPTSSSTGKDFLNFVKKDGKWVMIAKGMPTQSSATSPQ